MEKIDSKKYISLKEATQYCNHTQEYLSLRARQGKLKSLKFGRNWVTTPKWVKEYTAVIIKKKRKAKKNKVSDSQYNLTYKINEADIRINKTKLKAKKEAPPPENLPIGDLIPILETKQTPTLPSFRFGLAFTLAIIVVFVGFIFAKGNIYLSTEQTRALLPLTIHNIYDNLVGILEYDALIFSDFRIWLEKNVKKTGFELSQSLKKTTVEYIASIKDGFKETRGIIGLPIKVLVKIIAE